MEARRGGGAIGRSVGACSALVASVVRPKGRLGGGGRGLSGRYMELLQGCGAVSGRQTAMGGAAGRAV